MWGFGAFDGVFSDADFGTTGTRSFVQPHPTDPSASVQFICLEGNESGTYFRGTARLVEGTALIPIPEEWRLVTDEEGITVQVTARGPGDVWVSSSSRDEIVLVGSADVEVDYLVNGVRRGFTASSRMCRTARGAVRHPVSRAASDPGGQRHPSKEKRVGEPKRREEPAIRRTVPTGRQRRRRRAGHPFIEHPNGV